MRRVFSRPSHRATHIELAPVALAAVTIAGFARATPGPARTSEASPASAEREERFGLECARLQTRRNYDLPRRRVDERLDP